MQKTHTRRNVNPPIQDKQPSTIVRENPISLERSGKESLVRAAPGGEIIDRTANEGKHPRIWGNYSKRRAIHRRYIPRKGGGGQGEREQHQARRGGISRKMAKEEVMSIETFLQDINFQLLIDAILEMFRPQAWKIGHEKRLERMRSPSDREIQRNLRPSGIYWEREHLG